MNVFSCVGSTTALINHSQQEATIAKGQLVRYRVSEGGWNHASVVRVDECGTVYVRQSWQKGSEDETAAAEIKGLTRQEGRALTAGQEIQFREQPLGWQVGVVHDIKPGGSVEVKPTYDKTGKWAKVAVEVLPTPPLPGGLEVGKYVRYRENPGGWGNGVVHSIDAEGKITVRDMWDEVGKYASVASEIEAAESVEVGQLVSYRKEPSWQNGIVHRIEDGQPLIRGRYEHDVLQPWALDCILFMYTYTPTPALMIWQARLPPSLFKAADRRARHWVC